MKHSIIEEESYSFSIQIIHFYKYLIYNHKEYILGKQLLRSGTSIGTNVEEALGAQSKKDFIAKISISYKEAREVNYWLRLISDSTSVPREKINILLFYSEELIRIITAILVTTKKNLNY